MAVTAWQSMFAASATGKCVVNVRYESIPEPTELFSGSLGNGDTGESFTHSGSTFQVSVADGVVSLECPEGNAGPNLMSVLVYPDGDTSSQQTQTEGISIFDEDGTTPWNSGFSYAGASTGPTVTLDDGTAPTTPSFATFAPQGSTGAYVGVFAGGKP